MPRLYSMREADAVGKIATTEIIRWLKHDPATRKITSVECDPVYQAKDIDLLWRRDADVVAIEVKGDRYSESENFFFETVSNKEAATAGCFLYTEADFVYYYFVARKRLFILPMPATRDWFKANLKSFKEVSTTTRTRNGSYTTIGRLVRIRDVMSALPNVREIDLAAEFANSDSACGGVLTRLLAALRFWR